MASMHNLVLSPIHRSNRGRRHPASRTGTGTESPADGEKTYVRSPTSGTWVFDETDDSDDYDDDGDNEYSDELDVEGGGLRNYSKFENMAPGECVTYCKPPSSARRTAPPPTEELIDESTGQRYVLTPVGEAVRRSASRTSSPGRIIVQSAPRPMGETATTTATEARQNARGSVYMRNGYGGDPAVALLGQGEMGPGVKYRELEPYTTPKGSAAVKYVEMAPGFVLEPLVSDVDRIVWVVRGTAKAVLDEPANQDESRKERLGMREGTLLVVNRGTRLVLSSPTPEDVLPGTPGNTIFQIGNTLLVVVDAPAHGPTVASLGGRRTSAIIRR